MKIVFVCTANICRSPMAEGMFRKMIEENGLEESVFCLSFGLAAKEGKRPPENAVAVCREIGVDISGHKARNLSSLKDLPELPDDIGEDGQMRLNEAGEVVDPMGDTEAPAQTDAGEPADV